MNTTIKYYTDGSTRNNGSIHSAGAWGFIGLEDNTLVRQYAVGETGTTNQRMELKAMIEACKDANQYYDIQQIDFYTDSSYLYNCYSQNWYQKWRTNNWVNSKNQPVANKDLWEQLIPFFEQENFSFHKVPGHSNDKWNNKIDGIVQSISKELKCK